MPGAGVVYSPPLRPAGHRKVRTGVDTGAWLDCSGAWVRGLPHPTAKRGSSGHLLVVHDGDCRAGCCTCEGSITNTRRQPHTVRGHLKGGSLPSSARADNHDTHPTHVLAGPAAGACVPVAFPACAPENLASTRHRACTQCKTCDTHTHNAHTTPPPQTTHSHTQNNPPSCP